MQKSTRSRQNIEDQTASGRKLNQREMFLQEYLKSQGGPLGDRMGGGNSPYMLDTGSDLTAALNTSYYKSEQVDPKLKQITDFDAIISVCDRKLQHNHANEKARYMKAMALIRLKDFQAALEEANQLLEIFPNTANFHFLRGHIYEKMAKLDKAIEEYTITLNLNPNHINAAYSRGSCENKLGNFNKAIEDYKFALSRDEERQELIFSPRRMFGGTQKANSNSLFLLENILSKSQTPRDTIGGSYGHLSNTPSGSALSSITSSSSTHKLMGSGKGGCYASQGKIIGSTDTGHRTASIRGGYNEGKGQYYSVGSGSEGSIGGYSAYSKLHSGNQQITVKCTSPNRPMESTQSVFKMASSQPLNLQEASKLHMSRVSDPVSTNVLKKGPVEGHTRNPIVTRFSSSNGTGNLGKSSQAVNEGSKMSGSNINNMNTKLKTSRTGNTNTNTNTNINKRKSSNHKEPMIFRTPEGKSVVSNALRDWQKAPVELTTGILGVQRGSTSHIPHIPHMSGQHPNLRLSSPVIMGHAHKSEEKQLFSAGRMKGKGVLRTLRNSGKRDKAFRGEINIGGDKLTSSVVSAKGSSKVKSARDRDRDRDNRSMHNTNNTNNTNNNTNNINSQNADLFQVMENETKSPQALTSPKAPKVSNKGRKYKKGVFKGEDLAWNGISEESSGSPKLRDRQRSSGPPISLSREPGSEFGGILSTQGGSGRISFGSDILTRVSKEDEHDIITDSDFNKFLNPSKNDSECDTPFMEGSPTILGGSPALIMGHFQGYGGSGERLQASPSANVINIRINNFNQNNQQIYKVGGPTIQPEYLPLALPPRGNTEWDNRTASFTLQDQALATFCPSPSSTPLEHEENIHESTETPNYKKSPNTAKELITKLADAHSFTRAFDAYDRGEYLLAINLFNNGLRVQIGEGGISDKVRAEGLSYRGFCLAHLGKYEDALLDFSTASTLSPLDCFIYFFKGLTLKKMKDYKQAVTSFGQAIKLNPQNGDFYYYEASCFYKLSLHMQCKHSLDRLLDLQPDNPKGYLKRARCNFELGHKDQCILDLKRTGELNPKSTKILLGLSKMWIKLKAKSNLFMALSLLNKCLYLDPNYLDALVLRGLLHEQLGKNTLAIDDFMLSIKKDPKNGKIYKYLSYCLQKMDRNEEGLQALTKAFELLGSRPDLHKDRGNIYKNLGRYKDAIDEYTKYLKLKGNGEIDLDDYINILQNRAFAYGKIGQFNNALTDYSKIIIKSPRDMHSIFNRGICHQKNLMYKKAIEDFSIVVSLDNKNSNAYFNRACCYEKIEQTENATKDFEKAISLHKIATYNS